MYWVVFINFETKLSAQHMPGSDPGRNQIPDVPPTASQSRIVQMIVAWNARCPKHAPLVDNVYLFSSVTRNADAFVLVLNLNKVNGLVIHLFFLYAWKYKVSLQLIKWRKTKKELQACDADPNKESFNVQHHQRLTSNHLKELKMMTSSLLSSSFCSFSPMASRTS